MEPSINLEMVKLFSSIITPIVIAFLGFIFHSRLKEIDQAREEQRIKLERRHEFRIQFNVEANFIGGQEGSCIMELLAVLENQGFKQ